MTDEDSCWNDRKKSNGEGKSKDNNQYSGPFAALRMTRVGVRWGFCKNRQRQRQRRGLWLKGSGGMGGAGGVAGPSASLRMTNL